MTDPNDAIIVRGIIADVAKVSGFAPEAILGESKQAGVSLARHLAIWRARQQGLTFVRLARLFQRDVSTIQYAVRKIGKHVKEGDDTLESWLAGI